jgi:serine/threonine protein kinase
MLLLLRCGCGCLQEYCDVGTLDSVVSSWEGEEEGDGRMLQRLLLLKDVAAGLQVLHANSVVHGDLVRV